MRDAAKAKAARVKAARGASSSLLIAEARVLADWLRADAASVAVGGACGC